MRVIRWPIIIVIVVVGVVCASYSLSLDPKISPTMDFLQKVSMHQRHLWCVCEDDCLEDKLKDHKYCLEILFNHLTREKKEILDLRTTILKQLITCRLSKQSIYEWDIVEDPSSLTLSNIEAEEVSSSFGLDTFSKPTDAITTTAFTPTLLMPVSTDTTSSHPFYSLPAALIDGVTTSSTTTTTKTTTPTTTTTASTVLLRAVVDWESPTESQSKGKWMTTTENQYYGSGADMANKHEDDDDNDKEFSGSGSGMIGLQADVDDDDNNNNNENANAREGKEQFEFDTEHNKASTHKRLNGMKIFTLLSMYLFTTCLI